MNIIEAMRTPNKHMIMTNIANVHYMRMYNIAQGAVITNCPSTMTYGYQNTINSINLVYSCVIYRAGKIAVFRANNIDSISSGFSGCYMATFTHNNNRYVAHIAMDGHANIKTEWNNNVQNNIINNVTLFKPTHPLFPLSTTGVWGIITSDNRCYRLTVNEVTQNLNGRRNFINIPLGFPVLMEMQPITNGLIP